MGGSVEEQEEETLVEAALRILTTVDPFEKARLGDSVASGWLHGSISQPYIPSRDLVVPDRPARLSTVCIHSILLSSTFAIDTTQI